MPAGELNLSAGDGRSIVAMQHALPGPGGQLLAEKQGRKKKNQEEETVGISHCEPLYWGGLLNLSAN
jgi:hypothetical protein